MNADEIRRAREAAGFDTQEAAAAAIGVSLDTYRSWESGKRNPKAASLKMIRAAFTPGETIIPPDDAAALREQVADLTRQLAELAATVAQLGAAVKQLRKPPEQPARGSR